MKKMFNAPKYLDKPEGNSIESIENMPQKIKEMLLNESFAVLNTSGIDELHSSLITFAVTEDFQEIILATPRNTKKYEHIINNQIVSLLADNRSSSSDEADINNLSALTVSGTAKIVENSDEIDFCKMFLLNRHPYLAEFVNANTTAIIKISVGKYYYVTNFQESFEWQP